MLGNTQLATSVPKLLLLWLLLPKTPNLAASTALSAFTSLSTSDSAARSFSAALRDLSSTALSFSAALRDLSSIFVRK
ncbi:unnamed protein product [Ectocarpus sp. CCAP 1310/34]|nr:unnamed protein product [Ectocarpus sp. CCAP 1310/34]